MSGPDALEAWCWLGLGYVVVLAALLRWNHLRVQRDRRYYRDRDSGSGR